MRLTPVPYRIPYIPVYNNDINLADLPSFAHMKLLPSLISLLSLEPTVPEINLLLASVKKYIHPRPTGHQTTIAADGRASP
ncbi:unnamed protein product, partial [Ectocarpus sp. 8 AP-2014]